MIGTGNRQWVWAAAATIACGGAVWLSAQSGSPVARGAAPALAARQDLPSPEAATAAGVAGAMSADDVAARFGTALDDAQRGAEGELAARQGEVDAAQLRPDALIAQAAGGRYAALDVQAHAAPPQAATKR